MPAAKRRQNLIIKFYISHFFICTEFQPIQDSNDDFHPPSNPMEISYPPIGVNIREQKSGTERTKKRKKLELVLFTTLGGATGSVVHRLDAKRKLPELR